MNKKELLKKIIKLRLKKKLYLEKPLASDPIKSITILKLLKKNRIPFVMSLPFQKTPWFRILQKKFYKKISNMLKLYGILNLNLTIQKIGKIKKNMVEES